ncbi:MAG: hypothetical protein MUC88_03210 [Planctomycetes bacterium]|jgi:hypothetical protein|nr:hypothetical protein [Planctomycetota bacterium]
MSTKSKIITVLVEVVLVGVSMANAGAWPGRVSGHHDRVLAHSTDTYRITFEGGEPAVVVVSGDGPGHRPSAIAKLRRLRLTMPPGP